MSRVIKFIDDNVAMPIKIVVPIVAFLLGATWYLSNILHEIRDNQKDSWTIQHQQLWVAKVRDQNPSLKLPEPLETVVRERNKQQQVEN